jgi:hypothetical protein
LNNKCEDIDGSFTKIGKSTIGHHCLRAQETFAIECAKNYCIDQNGSCVKLDIYNNKAKEKENHFCLNENEFGDFGVIECVFG